MHNHIAFLYQFNSHRTKFLLPYFFTFFCSDFAAYIRRNTVSYGFYDEISMLNAAFNRGRPIFGGEIGGVLRSRIITKPKKKQKYSLSRKNESIYEAEKYLAYLLYGSVASLPSPRSNIEAWPYGTSLRFASLLHLGH